MYLHTINFPKQKKALTVYEVGRLLVLSYTILLKRKCSFTCLTNGLIGIAALMWRH